MGMWIWSNIRRSRTGLWRRRVEVLGYDKILGVHLFENNVSFTSTYARWTCSSSLYLHSRCGIFSKE